MQSEESLGFQLLLFNRQLTDEVGGGVERANTFCRGRETEIGTRDF